MDSVLRKYSVRLNEPVVDSGGTLYEQEKSFGVHLDGGKVRVSLYRIAAHGIAGQATQDVAFIAVDQFGGVSVRDTVATLADVAQNDNLGHPDLKRYIVADDLVVHLTGGNVNSDVIATVTVEHFFS